MAKKRRRDLGCACAYCENASLLHDNDYVLCERFGVVSAGYSCRRFSYDPLKRVPMPRKRIDTDIDLPELP